MAIRHILRSMLLPLPIRDTDAPRLAGAMDYLATRSEQEIRSVDTTYGTLTCVTVDERTEEDKAAEDLRLKQRSQPLADALAAAQGGRPQ